MTHVLQAFRLDEQTALVTGARRGIGKAIAEGLAEAGADLLGVSAQMTADGGELGDHVRELGRKFVGYGCDFSDRSATDAWIQNVLAEHGCPEILVANAGSIRRSPAAQHTDEDWDYILEVNLSSAFRMAREFGKRMVERGSGKIIFTASLLTFQGGVTVPGYAATKGAIGQVTKALANEWASAGVNVNAIAPGYIATDNTRALQKDETRSRQILERIPAARWGQPEDFKGPAVFLASAAANYVPGEILVVDGGWMGR